MIAFVYIGKSNTLALKKSNLEPQQCLTFLGLNVHTDKRYFSIPDEKLMVFKDLRLQILAQRSVHVKTLQKIMGKCISFSLCIPGAKLHIREMAAAVGRASKSSKPVEISGSLKEELEFWKFLDTHPK